MTLQDFLNLDGDARVDAAFDAWLDDIDCGRWDLSDFKSSCACEEARFHFETWFEVWVSELPDPDEREVLEKDWKALDEQGTGFYEACYDSMWRV